MRLIDEMRKILAQDADRKAEEKRVLDLLFPPPPPHRLQMDQVPQPRFPRGLKQPIFHG